jgi:Subtilase family
MADHPLLIFPEPAVVFKQTGKSRNIPLPRRPSVGEQRERLGPKLARLQFGFDPERLTLQGRPEGLEPEKALVLEIEGSIENFQNAVRRIEGLEWLADWEGDELEPDDRFFFQSRDDEALEDPIKSRLYITMADRRGAEELVSLWRRFEEADGKVEFERGLNRFRDLFRQLYDLRFWDLQDRLEETGLREAWQERLEEGGEAIRAEIELWYRKQPERREIAERWTGRLIREAGGRVLARCEIQEIDYHALLAEFPIEAFESVFEKMDAELIRCDDVMFLRPRGQVVVEPIGEEPAERLPQSEIRVLEDSPANREPRVALFDGLPLENHDLLRERLLVDDPDDWAAEYPADERHHGTAMASLIIHGDLAESTSSLRRPLYLRPVLRPESYWAGSVEAIPSDVLTLDLVHRAVRRIFEDDGAEPPAAPTVVAICLSLGDKARPFLHAMSPWARLIDHLSYAYRVLFVISAGNHGGLEVTLASDEMSDARVLERQILQAVVEQGRLRRLLSPAESINGLTIGALHVDSSQIGPLGFAFDPQPSGEQLPAYYSAIGSGYRRSVKPDLMLPGGRQPVRKRYGAPPGIEAVQTSRPPGQLVASPRRASSGHFGTTSHSRGTSNASALAARAVGILLEELEDSSESPLRDLPRDQLAILAKALLAHGSSQGVMCGVLRDRLPELPASRREAARYLGYGSLDLRRVLRCTDERATLIGLGDLSRDKAHRFRIPLPPSLASRREWRRLTVTLAWWSPIRSSHQKYRQAALWFEPYGEQRFETRTYPSGYERTVPVGSVEAFDALERLALSRREVDHQQVRNGTVQHEIFEGESAMPFLDGDEVHIQVNCRAEAGRLSATVPYALAVTLEVAEGVGVPIYEEIKDRIRVPVTP